MMTMTDNERIQEIREHNKRFWEADTDFLLQTIALMQTVVDAAHNWRHGLIDKVLGDKHGNLACAYPAVYRLASEVDNYEALTVSKQGVSTDSEDDCEQTVEKSKNPPLVARQDTPNEPTEHNYQLAQHDLSKEVAADKLWRGEKT
jgi:hypothetical protein